MAKKKFLFDWTGFFTKHLVSASVEDGAKSDVILTFTPFSAVKAFNKSVKTEFTLAGKTVDHIHVTPATGTVTVNVTVAYAAGADFNLTFNPVKKGDTVVRLVHNHVA